MSFVNNLAKGFVRSAVNQVGRDGGKVISNRIYGDSHSTPVRIVGNNGYQSSEGLIENKEYILIKWIYACLLTLLIPVFGGLIIAYRGYVNINKDYKLMSIVEKQDVYKSDKRYTTGKKYLGYQEVRKDVKVDITEDKIKSNKFKSIGYFIISLIGVIGYIIYYTKK